MTCRTGLWTEPLKMLRCEKQTVPERAFTVVAGYSNKGGETKRIVNDYTRVTAKQHKKIMVFSRSVNTETFWTIRDVNTQI